MSHLRVRVRPPHSHRGLLVLSAVIAAVLVVPTAVFSATWMYLPQAIFLRGNWLLIINLTQLGLILVPFFTFVVWLSRQCQHTSWVAATGAAYWFVLVLMVLLANSLSMPHWGFDPLHQLLMAFAVASLIGAVAAIVVMKIYRMFFRRVIEQDGTLCSACGYPVSRSKSANCPECGEQHRPATTTRGERAIAACARNGRAILVAMLVLFTLGYGWAILAERQHRTLGENFGDMWIRSDRPAFFDDDRSASAVYRPIRIGRHDAEAILMLEQTHAFCRPDLELRIAYVQSGQDVWPFAQHGSAIITIAVPREQFREVLRHGPPDTAIARLIETAETEGWLPVEHSPERKRIVVDWSE
jgi:hypothetical protein